MVTTPISDMQCVDRHNGFTDRSPSGIQRPRSGSRVGVRALLREIKRVGRHISRIIYADIPASVAEPSPIIPTKTASMPAHRSTQVAGVATRSGEVTAWPEAPLNIVTRRRQPLALWKREGLYMLPFPFGRKTVEEVVAQAATRGNLSPLEATQAKELVQAAGEADMYPGKRATSLCSTQGLAPSTTTGPM